MRPTMIRRHSRKGIFLHWFNTGCWLFLLFTGVGLLNNKDFQPLGMWWPALLHWIFGAPQNLLIAHEACGILWISVLAVYSLLFWRTEVFPFLKEVLTVSVKSDGLWLIKKMTMMTAGSAPLRKFGLDSHLPDQGFYNVGQKMFAAPAVFVGLKFPITS